MTIRVLAFASLADRLGKGEFSLDLDEGTSVSDALDALAKRFPDVKSFGTSLAVAVNHRYVASDSPLSAGDELALIPPVSGG